MSCHRLKSTIVDRFWWNLDLRAPYRGQGSRIWWESMKIITQCKKNCFLKCTKLQQNYLYFLGLFDATEAHFFYFLVRFVFVDLKLVHIGPKIIKIGWKLQILGGQRVLTELLGCATFSQLLQRKLFKFSDFAHIFAFCDWTTQPTSTYRTNSESSWSEDSKYTCFVVVAWFYEKL